MKHIISNDSHKVKLAAEKAGYNIGPVYHGTNEIFNIFDPLKSNFRFGKKQMLFFFAFNKDSARKRGGSLDPVKHVIKCYLKCNIQGHYDDNDVLTPANADYVIIEDFMVSVLNPNQIKLADDITYDNNGKPIPLNKRFNSKTNDIRY